MEDLRVRDGACWRGLCHSRHHLSRCAMSGRMLDLLCGTAQKLRDQVQATTEYRPEGDVCFKLIPQSASAATHLFGAEHVTVDLNVRELHVTVLSTQAYSLSIRCAIKRTPGTSCTKLAVFCIRFHSLLASVQDHRIGHMSEIAFVAAHLQIGASISRCMCIKMQMHILD